jgi:hypothetical protein
LAVVLLVQNKAMAAAVPPPARGSFVVFTERAAVFDFDPEKQLIFTLQPRNRERPCIFVGVVPDLNVIWNGRGRVISSFAGNEKWRHQKIVPTNDCIGLFWCNSNIYSDRGTFDESGGFAVVSDLVQKVKRIFLIVIDVQSARVENIEIRSFQFSEVERLVACSVGQLP